MEDNDSSRKSGEILQEKLPKSIQSTGTRFHTETDDVAPVSEVTKSAVSNALLRSEDVPFSDVTTDLH
eukprot:CCRYP_003877-RA/>CCRYP_003877-RA protein AED:0.48 eAED:0.48 QI:0/-1/0/1/-1/1/1/0/67